jgi:hypothetical protein
MPSRLAISVCRAALLLLVTACEHTKDGDEEADASALVEGKDGGPRAADANESKPTTGDASASNDDDASQSVSVDAGTRRPDAGTSPVDAASTPSSCAATTCPVGNYCDDITGSAKCIAAPSCDTVKCMAGTVCELVTVQCIRAPCPAQPQCVASPGSGADGGVACGKRTCATGQRCCSASCGICGSASGACPAIACVPESQN